MDQFGARLRERRKYYDLTQAELAEALNVSTQLELAEALNISTQVISNWERGYTQPNKDELFYLSYNLGVSVDYLIGLSKDPLTVHSNGPSIDLLKLIDSDNPISYGDYHFTEVDKIFVANMLQLITARLKEKENT